MCIYIYEYISIYIDEYSNWMLYAIQQDVIPFLCCVRFLKFLLLERSPELSGGLPFAVCNDSHHQDINCIGWQKESGIQPAYKVEMLHKNCWEHLFNIQVTFQSWLGPSLRHSGRDNMAVISQTIVSSTFCQLKTTLNFTEICSFGSNWQYGSIGSNNRLALTRRQAIIWTNDG